MTNDESLRDRDESARDRDEASRKKDEKARDDEQVSQRATRSARTVQTWATLVLILMVGGLSFIVGQRNDAIDDLQSAAMRIERAATNTEQVLVEVVESQRTPEALAQAQRFREALQEIAVIQSLLCELPELTDMPPCQD